MRDAPDVLVVGAGPSGMSMAIEARRAGLSVRIIDRSEQAARHSQALVLQARTLEQLQRYGIAEKAVARGRKLTRAKFWSGEKQIAAFDFKHIASRYPYLLFLPQSETEAILNEYMVSLGLRTERAVELLALERGERASATVRHADGRIETIAPRWIVGCDGARSAVRAFSAIPFEGAHVGLSFFLGDLQLDGPDVPTDELSLHLHSGGDVVFMGRLDEKLTRIIVALHSEQAGERAAPLTESDFQRAIDRAHVRATVRSSAWMTPFRVNDLQAKHYRAGNVFLAGDAAHIHSPVGGQGMNTGIQDAANLGWKLAAASRGAEASLLESYEQERGEVGRALLKMTGRALKLATASHPLLEQLRDVLLPLLSQPAAVQDLMARLISEIAIHYRFSPINEDHGGDGYLQPGDRMPDYDLTMNGKRTTLLRDFRDSRHLAIVINGSAAVCDEIAAHLEHTQIMALRDADFDDTGRRDLGAAPKLLILRPDGYLGFRAPLRARGGSGEELRRYAVRQGLAAR